MNAAQEQLVIDHMYLIPRLASRIKRTHRFADKQEMIGEGYLALVKAAINFQAKSKFTTYMYKAVRGAMYATMSGQAYGDVKRMQLFSIDALLNNPAPAYSELGRLSRTLARQIVVDPRQTKLIDVTRARLYDCLPLLRSDFQYIIKRKLMDEATDLELSQELMLTPMAVQKRFIRAKDDLQALFEGREVTTRKARAKGTPKATKKAELVYCMCGCGTLIPMKGLNGAIRKYAANHVKRKFNPNISGFESTQEVVDGKKKCSKCSELKDLDEFAKNKLRSSGRDAACKLCKRTAQNERARAKKESLQRKLDAKLDKF